MLLRCSICKGQFEIEPNPHKTTVYCSHCGAPLDMKPKARRSEASVATASSLMALAGETVPEAAPQKPVGKGVLVQQPPQQRTSQSPGEYGFNTRPAFPPDPVPAQTASSDPLASLASAAHAPYGASTVMRKKSRKKNNSAAIMLIVGTTLVCIVVLAVVLIIHFNQTPEAAPAPPPPPAHSPGEMFPNVPTEKTPAEAPQQQ
jgi:hypothetical protein